MTSENFSLKELSFCYFHNIALDNDLAEEFCFIQNYKQLISLLIKKMF